MIDKLKNTFRKYFRSMTIIADSLDSSISLSENLLSYVRDDLGSVGRVSARIVENIDTDYRHHFFIQFYPWTEDKVLYSSSLARNDLYDSIGFETLCPTVNYIFYYYSIPDKIKELKVRPRKIGNKHLYEILYP